MPVLMELMVSPDPLAPQEKARCQLTRLTAVTTPAGSPTKLVVGLPTDLSIFKLKLDPLDHVD